MRLGDCWRENKRPSAAFDLIKTTSCFSENMEFHIKALQLEAKTLSWTLLVIVGYKKGSNSASCFAISIASIASSFELKPQKGVRGI